MKKITFLNIVASPFEIKWANSLIGNKEFKCNFIFFSRHEDFLDPPKPDYWNIPLPKNGKIYSDKVSYLNILSLIKLYKYLNNLSTDIIVLKGYWYKPYFITGYIWAVLNGKKIISGPMEFSQKLYKPLTQIRNTIVFGYFFKKINLWLANSFIHYDYLYLKLGLNTYLFSNFDDYKPYINIKRISPSRKVRFLFGGSFDSRNRVLEIIETFEELSRTTKNIELVLAGFGPQKKLCEKVVNNSANLRKVVSFMDVDNWDNIVRVFKSADVFCHYGSFSPGGGVIYSAVASGMPVISMPSIQATRHVVIDQFNGKFIYNKNDLKKAIKFYASKPKKIEIHGKRSREISKEFLNFDTHNNEFFQMVNSLFGQ